MVDMKPCKFLMKPFDPRPPAGVRELEGLGKGLDEASKLRQMADLRTGITSGKPILAKVSPSTPNLHDFSTKTHLARLDISHEKLDAFVEQKVEELRSAIVQKSQDFENLLNQRVGAVEEQLATVRNSLPKEQLSEASAKGGEQEDADLRKRIASLEERLSLSSSAQGGKNDVTTEMAAELLPNINMEERLPPDTHSVSEVPEEVKPLSVRDAIDSGEVNAETSDAEAHDVDASSQKCPSTNVTQSVQNRICSARAESLRAAVSELAGQQEALRIEKIGSLEDRFIVLRKQVEAIARLALNSSTEADDFKSKCIKAQVLLEEKITSTESKLTIHREECTKLFESLLFRPRQETEKIVQSVVDRCKAIETQLEDFSSSFAGMHEQAKGLNGNGSQDSQPQGQQTHTLGVPLLWVGKYLAEMPCAPDDASVRLMALEEEVRNTSDAVTQVEQQLSSVPSQKDLQSVRARLEGGLKAVLTRVEAHHYVKEQEDAASDRVFRTFSLKTDERINMIENHINKNDNILDRVIEKSHLKVKSIAVPTKCPQCGTFNGREVVNCAGCGAQRTHELIKTKSDKHKRTKAILIWQKDKLDKKVIEYNDKLVSVIFDLWARGGDNAHCVNKYKKLGSRRLSESPRRLSESPRKDSLSPRRNSSESPRKDSFSPRRSSLAPPTPAGVAPSGALQSSPPMSDSLGKTVLSKSIRSESPRGQLDVPQKRNWLLSRRQ